MPKQEAGNWKPYNEEIANARLIADKYGYKLVKN